ncbi:MAG: aminotransferase class III-fold pyridoxal phosphate-dependent enzyme, partial [Anaerovoracaceae bacterium]
LITFAKGMGGGLPIGGVIFSDRAKGALSKGDHGSTFGANPIVCAGAMAVVDTVNEEFLRQVKEKGAYMAEVIRGFSGVEAVSGRGLMLGIKLKPQEGRTSASIVKAAIDKGLLVLTAKEKVRLLPPLNISKEEMEKGLAILKELLD